MKSFILAVVAIASAIVPAPGQAQSAAGFDLPNADRPSRQVRIAGIDLSSADGIAMLNLKIRGAARALCGARPAVDLRSRMAQRTCMREAVTSADGQVELAVAKAASRRFASTGAQVAVASPVKGY